MSEAVPVSDERLAEIRRIHVIEEPEYHLGPRHCDACWEDWPCDMVGVIALLDHERSLRSQEPAE